VRAGLSCLGPSQLCTAEPRNAVASAYLKTCQAGCLSG
jgi:hypothetical protein